MASVREHIEALEVLLSQAQEESCEFLETAAQQAKRIRELEALLEQWVLLAQRGNPPPAQDALLGKTISVLRQAERASAMVT
jgi:hypothetical protein